MLFKLRPIDSLGVRPDSNFFPTSNGTGLSKAVYPNANTTEANVKAASTTNFIVGLDFLSRVQAPPAAATPTTAGAIRYIPSRIYGGVTVFRPQVPNVTWESANTDYLDINSAGSVTGKCAAIGGTVEPGFPGPELIRQCAALATGTRRVMGVSP